jgi:hypothetical protein
MFTIAGGVILAYVVIQVLMTVFDGVTYLINTPTPKLSDEQRAKLYAQSPLRFLE